MATDAQIVAIVTLLEEAYPQRQALQGTTVALYRRLLADLDGNMLLAAAHQHIADSKWFPTVAELREGALALSASSAGIPTAMEAWGEVVKALNPRLVYHHCETGKAIESAEVYEAHRQTCRECGWRHETPAFSVPLIEQAVNHLGGLKRLARSDNEVADRAHFMRAYDQLAARETKEQKMLPEVRQQVAALAHQLSAGG